MRTYSLLKARICGSKPYMMGQSDKTNSAECRQAFDYLYSRLSSNRSTPSNKIPVEKILDIILT